MALQQEMVAQGNRLFRYRGVLPVLIVLPALLLKFWGTPDAWMAGRAEYITAIAYGLALIGLALRFIVVGYAPLRTSGRNTEEQIADSLSRTGLYSMVRHPLYLGNFFMWLGCAVLTFNAWFIGLFVMLYWVYYERIMLAEEDYLRGKFGQAFEEWAAARPAFLPQFSKWVGYEQPFRFYKALYQEKTGWLWLNLIFWLFQVDPAAGGSQVYRIPPIWSALLIVSALLYVLLKLIGKKS